MNITETAMGKNKGQELIEAMRDLNELRVLQLTVEMMSEGVSSYEIFENLLTGIQAVDSLYEEGEYFIADLIMSGHIMKSVMTKVLVFKGYEEYSSFGRVVIATVKNDIHELGKNVITEILRYNGFQVHDLGVDVSSERIVEAVREEKPNILILSGTLNESLAYMTESIRALEAAGLRKNIRIIVGGAPVTAKKAAGMGSDAFSMSVMDCLKTCHEFMAMAAGEH
jgi:dimethylamine corrinoid protein